MSASIHVCLCVTHTWWCPTHCQGLFWSLGKARCLHCDNTALERQQLWGHLPPGGRYKDPLASSSLLTVSTGSWDIREAGSGLTCSQVCVWWRAAKMAFGQHVLQLLLWPCCEGAGTLNTGTAPALASHTRTAGSDAAQHSPRQGQTLPSSLACARKGLCAAQLHHQTQRARFKQNCYCPRRGTRARLWALLAADCNRNEFKVSVWMENFWSYTFPMEIFARGNSASTSPQTPLNRDPYTLSGKTFCALCCGEKGFLFLVSLLSSNSEEIWHWGFFLVYFFSWIYNSSWLQQQILLTTYYSETNQYSD